jgi:hypothetical protein
VNTGHLAKDCPKDGPVTDVKLPSNTSDNQKNHISSAKPVAMVVSQAEEDTVDTKSTSPNSYGNTNPRIEILGSSSFPITAIMPPPNEFSILEGEENSDESVSPSSYYVSTPALPVKLSTPSPSPLSVPHLQWRAAIANANPNCLNRHIVETILDDGSHLVLINESLVNELQLQCQKLHKPILKNLALLTRNDPENCFEEWTKLKVYDPANLWAAWSVRAVITPALCTDVLLGLPFLSVNKLITVIGHALIKQQVLT